MWLNMLFEVTLELDGHINAFNSETINLQYLVEKKIYEKPWDILWDADPNCDHDIETLSSGVRCKKCKGWCCL